MNALVKMRRFGAVLAIAAAALLGVVLPLTAQAAAMGDATENSVIDWFLRGQAYTPPATAYVALATATGSDAACGTEVTGGSYARASIASSLANWAGTQSAGSTVASSGTSGTTSNNIAINFATPSAGWGTVTEFCVMSAVTGGTLLFRSALTVSKTINSGDTVSFPIGALTFQVDN